MQRQACAQDGRCHNLAVWRRDACDAERSDVFLVAVFQLLTDLIGENLSHTFEVSAETQTVLLDVHVAHLCDEFVENRVLLSKIDDLHILSL